MHPSPLVIKPKLHNKLQVSNEIGTLAILMLWELHPGEKVLCISQALCVAGHVSPVLISIGKRLLDWWNHSCKPLLPLSLYPGPVPVPKPVPFMMFWRQCCSESCGRNPEVVKKGAAGSVPFTLPSVGGTPEHIARGGQSTPNSRNLQLANPSVGHQSRH
ncbi:tumor necrosis factor receptor superfamily member 1B [Platysternon megacephalum]|uniref:Tumor necrosis factor receptor superfamily member 1B n=1 Tax=Platysternon megacephalum TaxID=55544 RepID=A0A4D9EUH9_9SAUR|nr:tumor necrosis factor receptor superfamily member 1B [Platysternon megacephalum]